VCLGSEHGVLVTDAGIPFTFGDNRFGQLGRDPCKLSENNEPFPVLDLLEHEIVQVAAGMHHCLALTASRFVWAWGRNKAGQLGCNDIRDKVAPEKVIRDARSGEPLGNIVTVSAGGNSSIAVSMNSDVLQWGEISSEFKVRQVQGPGEKSQKAPAYPVERKLPHSVLSRRDLTARRKEAKSVSVSATGCRTCVKGKTRERDQTTDLFKTARKWQRSVADLRDELAKLSAMNKKDDGVGGCKEEAADMKDNNDLNDAIRTMRRHIHLIDREIYLMERNEENCKLQQKNLRDQLMVLTGQGARLAAKENQMALSMVEAKGNERNLDKDMSEIKALLDANQTTRATLLEQRTQTDKELQRMDWQLKEKKIHKDEQLKRLRSIEEIQKSISAKGTSDRLLEGTREILHMLEARTRDDGRVLGDFQGAMAALEREDVQLAATEARLRELAAGLSEPERAERAGHLADLMQSLVDLHRFLNGLAEDRWAGSDQDLSGFFGDAGRPLPPWGHGPGGHPRGLGALLFQG